MYPSAAFLLLVVSSAALGLSSEDYDDSCINGIEPKNRHMMLLQAPQKRGAKNYDLKGALVPLLPVRDVDVGARALWERPAEILGDAVRSWSHSVSKFRSGGNSEFQRASDNGGELNEAKVDTCGTRVVLPHLQFDLEVYRSIGLVDSRFSHCRVPNIRTIALTIPTGASVMAIVDAMYDRLDAVMGSRWLLLRERRTLLARAVVVMFAMSASLAILSSVRAVRAPEKQQGQSAVDSPCGIQAAWMRGCSHWLKLGWLEPVIGHYAWATARPASAAALDLPAEDVQFTAYSALREIWHEDIELHGLENADILRAVRRFLGMRAIFFMLLTGGMTMFGELVGMTVVLDMLIHYLHLISAARVMDPLVSLDALRPAVMFVGLGFGVPILTRACANMTCLCDTYHTNRVVAALLTMIYEKCQSLPAYVRKEQKEKANTELAHLLTCDVRRIWIGALLSYTYLAVYPACIGAILAFLCLRLGRAAVYGLLATFWVGLGYIPLRKLVMEAIDSWSVHCESRMDAVKEVLLNVRAVKATALQVPLSERVQALREKELQSQSHLCTVQSLLDALFCIFPLGLPATSLFFCRFLGGSVRPAEIFTCMQAFSALNLCMPIICRALRRHQNLQGSARRIESFLREPECRARIDVRRPEQVRGAPHVRVMGSFASAEGQPPLLRDMQFSAKRGELVAVIGEVASGKSALLAAILGELPGMDSEACVEAPKAVTYCSQKPWIVEGSVQENVTLGEPQDIERLYDALEAASLVRAPPPGGFAKRGDQKLGTAQVDIDAGAQTAVEPLTRRELEANQDQPNRFVFPYFRVWNIFAVIAFVLSMMNINWQKTKPSLGILISVIQGILHWSVLEFPIQTAATLMTKARQLNRADCSHLTLVMNYNLLATSQADVDECMHNMFEAYLNNLDEKVSSVLVSATNDPNLQQYELQVRNDYRARIYKEVFRSGLSWAGFVEGGSVDTLWHKRVWSKYEHIDRYEFVRMHLHPICERYAKEFMVLHRKSRVLRKCGQYQDLILLAAGEDIAYTYCDEELYGRAARKEGEPLFNPGEDTDNVRSRHFDYTLVLDSDTRVEAGTVFDVLEVAAAYPDSAIVQPAIKMDCGPEDSVFMHLEAMRQRVYEPMNSTMTTLFGRSSFFGKGLIKNSTYRRLCLGTRENLIESVPIDVLSHDTFEAAVTSPLYCSSVYLLEAPCHNYITWDIRERRWNLGELLLAMYFWPSGVGRPVRWLQSKIQGRKFNRINVRTRTTLDEITSYFAHSALRQMSLKPMLLGYIVTLHYGHMHYPLTPFVTVMFCIMVVPKFATCTRHNYRDVLLETGASTLQFTPEAVVGTIRVVSAVKAHLAGAATWVPQRSVEEESKVSNPFLLAVRYLWYYSVFAVVWGLQVGLWSNAVGPESMFIVTILGTLFMLPLYVGFTSLPANVLHGFDRGIWRGGAGAGANDAPGGGVQADQLDASLQTFRNRLPQLSLQAPVGPNAEAAARVSMATGLLVGVRGARLSPGEEYRIALARAAYSRCSSLVLIDDPFANVDARTGEHILHKLICGPLMSGRTRIVAMQPYVDYLEHFDRVVLLKEGRIVLQGSPADVLAAGEFREMIAKKAKDTGLDELNLVKGRASRDFESPLQIENEVVGYEDEHERQGTLNFAVLGTALADGGCPRLLFCIIPLVLLRIALKGQIFLLGSWADNAATQYASQPAATGMTYTVAMLLLVVSICLCQLLQNYAMASFCEHVSRGLFQRAFTHMLGAPLAMFWDMQPVCSALCRFSSDLLNVDSMLPSVFVTLGSCALDFLLLQLYCFVVVPIWLVIPTFMMTFSFCKLLFCTIVNLQYYTSLALSRCQDERTNIGRTQMSVRAHHPYENTLINKYCAHASLAVTPDSLTSCAKMWVVSLVTFCLCFEGVLFGLVGVFYPDRISSGTLVVVTASTFTMVHQLGSMCDAIADAVPLALSLMRIMEHTRIPIEASPESIEDPHVFVQRMQSVGVGIRIERLTAGYGRSTDTLTNVNIDIAPRSKVAFVGPPGCGKTTALLCILRIVEPRQGRVLLNGVDTQGIGIDALRAVVGLVPQEPVAFRGTIRFNVDPLGTQSDETVWMALQCAQLLPAVKRLSHGLDHMLVADGRNLSAGQRKLLGLARAVCRQPPVLLLDECSAGLDPLTLEAIQDTIMLSFPSSTLVAATGRLDEAANYNQAVVFDGGTVVRQGPVSALTLKPSLGS